MGNSSERDARASRRNQLREEAAEDGASSEEVFIISLFNISHTTITLSTLSWQVFTISFFQHLSTHCIALVVQETDEHLEDSADSSSEEVFAIFDHSQYVRNDGQRSLRAELFIIKIIFLWMSWTPRGWAGGQVLQRDGRRYNRSNLLEATKKTLRCSGTTWLVLTRCRTCSTSFSLWAPPS